MKLKDIESSSLLPRFAHDSEWIQIAFDVIVKHVFDRSKSIDAPLTIEAIHALTDEELQALYEQFGIVKYYPDLSRETREKMLFEVCWMYRYLGTPKAIETLCNYIFDGIELNVSVDDNQAFDESGNLVNPDLIDTFDIIIGPQIPVLNEDANARILENVINFSRNSQYLNGICYDFNEDLDVSVSPALKDDNPVCTVDILNDAMCEPVEPPIVEPEYSYVVINEQTGVIVHSIASSPMIIVITPSVTMQSFYFTSNGSAETEDTLLESGIDAPLYNADGSIADDALYDGSLAIYFTEESGNMTLADSEFLEYSDGHLSLNMDGNTRNAWSVQVEYAYWVDLFVVMDSTESNDIRYASNKLPFGVMS